MRCSCSSSRDWSKRTAAGGWSSRRSTRPRSASFTRFALRSMRWRRGLPPSGCGPVDRPAAAAGGAAGARGRPDAAPRRPGPGLHPGGRRVSHRALPALRQSRDRGYGRGAVAALQALDGHRAGRSRAAPAGVARARRKSCSSCWPATLPGPRARRGDHTDRAGAETARRLAQSAGYREGDRDGTYGAAAPAVR